MDHRGEQPPALVRRYDVERSCIRCHERKLRCDKATPCSMCLRAKVPCCYPGPERVKRRSKRLSAKPRPRLQMLERDVAGINGPSEVDRDATDLNKSERQPVEEAEGPRLSNGLLVKEGSSARYINESLLSRVLENECDLQSAIDIPDNPTDSDQTQADDGFDGLFSNPLLGKEASGLHPSRGQAAQLWQVYLNNVDVLLKILHIPATEPVFFAAISNPKQTRADQKALLFAIYYAAVTSLSSSATHVILSEDRHSVLSRYQRGLEVSLHMASFLDSPTIPSLQTMAIYLSIGLHRDGRHFHLSPFDCEIRRRLWWATQGYDTRVAEDHGFSLPDPGPSSDTELPLNIDDHQLYPNMKEPPTPRACWTETTMFLITIEMNRAMRQASQLSNPPTSRKSHLETLLSTLQTRLHTQYLQHCNPHIPIQKCALLLGRICLGRLEVFLHHQDSTTTATTPTDKTLSLAIETITLADELKTSDLLTSYHWLFSTFPQYHLLTYVLWHLCICPQTPCAEQAWTVVTVGMATEAIQRGFSGNE
ncbi:hypothetical protein BO94DRAFT_627325 [Aspergillus sclerotioniger CBS 115572]|uniref:Zn(2)-C6 fungal-type domain-containing protein n=1 Tax=Aspergillus sclerotioniger CBS 115572 TaxID=1450535 RepID=A0A317VQL9_9EURO|nr:hypothetical protein BO94DRAFT_627325 [Aspergillus sclerotioniger CBS 115572]PWY75337.1 hypothetical protein BO94DRAFT_627325 [Aspergillus sclerotioniger CBS 115572]